jgi:ataxia telangiectasia mutated family protein
MQQFFGLVNSVLAGDPAAARRRLGMVTYKVVPFSPAAGLVQWVEHTVPLTDYLLGRDLDRRTGAASRWGQWGVCGSSVWAV